MEWSASETALGTPCAILKDGEKIIAKVYLSMDKKVLRVVLTELALLNQLKIDVGNKIVDFRRKP